jgi:hypothetical protein
MPERCLSPRSSSRPIPALIVLVTALVAPRGVAAATITVTTLSELPALGGGCTFREALLAAETDAPSGDCPAGDGFDRIEFAVAGTIDLASDLPALTESLEIAGPGVAELVVRGNNHRMLVLDGDPNGQTLIVSGIVVRDGANADSGGCVAVGPGDHLRISDARVLSCASGESGGGVAGRGAASVHLVRSRIANNDAQFGGGGVVVLGVPALPGTELSSELRIEECTIADNDVVADDVGGGIGVLFTRLDLVRSTVSGNSALSFGGGIFAGASEVTLQSSTIVQNEGSVVPPLAPWRSVGTSLGGGLYAATEPVTGRATTVSLRSSLFAGNETAGNRNELAADASSTFTSLGFNFLSTNDGVPAVFPAGEPNPLQDWVGNNANPLPHGLGQLVNNGGPTFTHLPQPGSIAIDNGSCPGERRDQRGFGDAPTNFRTVDDPAVPNADAGCDIGAVEADAVELPFLLLVDGFESADTAAWSSTLP